jgi:hypothetical protein
MWEIREQNIKHFKNDCETRWNSTLFMVQRCLELLPVVQRVHIRAQLQNQDTVAGLEQVLLPEPTVQQLRRIESVWPLVCKFLMHCRSCVF